MPAIRIHRQVVFAVVCGMVIAVAPTLDPAQAVAQGCSDSEIEDSYSLQCVPSTVPDFNDQITEAEAAEPGFNSHPGGDGGGGGHR